MVCSMQAAQEQCTGGESDGSWMGGWDACGGVFLGRVSHSWTKERSRDVENRGGGVRECGPG